MSKISFLDILRDKSVIVPTIQRDYAQGRSEGKNKDLCEEVRTNLVNNLHNALINDTELVLDYVYGSDSGALFYPIDGQQRLTTLFLLHWYIGKKEGVTGNDFELLNKFSYEIRDTSKEFCKDLIEIDIDTNHQISRQIENSSKFHDAYNHDPTIKSMLVVLDEINKVFKDDCANLWDRLSKIKFWYLTLQEFGLTDDLFVKMNARGKRLSRFDVFKSDLESKLSKQQIQNPNLDTWKREIDNSYLDNFWVKFGVNGAEKNLFRTILFFLKLMVLAVDTDVEYDVCWETDLTNAKYYDVINLVCSNDDYLLNVCNILEHFNEWFNLLEATSIFAVDDEKETLTYNKLIIFGVLYWFAKGHQLDTNFYELQRILENYIFSLRQANIKPRRYYSSSVDVKSKSLNRALAFIKRMIDDFDTSRATFDDFVRTSQYQELDFEKAKLESIHNGLVAKDEVIQLEQLPYLGKNVHNVFINGLALFSANDLNAIFNNPTLTNLALRTIYSYAADDYGKFNDLLFDPISMQSGKKQLYYNNSDDWGTSYFHKYSFQSNEIFGDRLLTAKGQSQYSAMSNCVQSFLTDLKSKTNGGTIAINDALSALFNDRIGLSDFSDTTNIKWYIVKYGEFFYEETNTTLTTLRRKSYVIGTQDINNVFDIQCISDDNDFDKNHYHPFYLALCHVLFSKNSRITIDENSLKYSGIHIEYLHPCVLSNGWIVRIQENGNWEITFNGTLPAANILDTYGITRDAMTGKWIMINAGTDCIEMMADFITNC